MSQMSIKLLTKSKGWLTVEYTSLHVLRYQKWNGYANRPRWQLVTLDKNSVPITIFYDARLLDDIKVFIRDNQEGKLKAAMKPERRLRARRK